MPNTLKRYVLLFSDLYHQYRAEAEYLNRAKYSICSSLDYYKQTAKIQLSFNDKPGDRLPPMAIKDVKNTPDLLAGLHPIDVNSINDLYYLSEDKIAKLVVHEDKIEVVNQNGQRSEYNVDEPFEHGNLLSKRIAFLVGYMQAERLMKKAYAIKEKYKIIRDHITTLQILDLETQKEFLKNPMDILFSDEYKLYSKEDVSKLGYICGQMSKI